jgi:DNA end-binding protein Ku
VVDLLAALQRSVEAAKTARGEDTRDDVDERSTKPAKKSPAKSEEKKTRKKPAKKTTAKKATRKAS